MRPVQNLLKFLGITGKYYASGWFNFSNEPKIIHDPRTGELIYDASHRIDWNIPQIHFWTSDIEKRILKSSVNGSLPKRESLADFISAANIFRVKIALRLSNWR